MTESYGSSATWSGTDTSGQANVDFTTDTGGQSEERRNLAASPAFFTLQANSTPVQAATAMAAAVGGTSSGAVVTWPAGTDITGLSFTVNGGSSITIPPMGSAPTNVVSNLGIKNIA